MFQVFELALVCGHVSMGGWVGDCLNGRCVVSCGYAGCVRRWFGFGR